MNQSASLDFLFHPSSIAIAGVSDKANKFNFGLKFLEALTQFGFCGKLYSVNPAGGEINGSVIYKSVKDIPGPVDHVVMSVPAVHTPAIMEECRQIGAKVVHVFTSGFAETGEPDRAELQERLVQIARQGNMRIIGPNCLGLC